MTRLLQNTYWVITAVLTLLLTVTALTGSIQAYYYEIDEWLNPEFYQAPDQGPLLHPADLIEQLEAQTPKAEVWYLQVADKPGRSSMAAVSPVINPDTGSYFQLSSNYFYLNPTNAAIIGDRYWGQCCFEAKNFVNFMYEMHHSMSIPGSNGFVLMGILACIWTISCIFLIARSVADSKGLSAIGLSPMLTIVFMIAMLPMAVSSVAMNFSAEVFKPIVSILSPVEPSIYERYAKKSQTDFGERNLSYRDAFELAQTLGRERGWTNPIGELFYSHSYNFYGMAFGFRDPQGIGNNWLYLNAEDGAIVGIKTPAEGTAGDLFYYSQLPFHSGRAIGFASQLFVFLLGLLIACLTFTLCIHALKRVICGAANDKP